jgi:ABC-type branched-subunit amino acid transport system substrate-binding protein
VKKSRTYLFFLGLSLILLFGSNSSNIQSEINLNQVPSEISLGGLFPLTGALAGGGVEREAASRMAVNEINSRADILPQTTLKMIVRDTGTNPTTGAVAAQELIDLGVFGLVGAASSSVSKAVADVATVAEVPQISYSSSNADLTNKTDYPYFKRVIAPDASQGVALANILYNNLGINLVSTLATSDDFGMNGITAFTSEFTALGGTIDVSQAFGQGSNDATTQLSAIASGVARTIVINTIVGDARTVMAQAGAAGISPSGGWQWVGTDSATQEAVFSGNAAIQAAMEDMLGTALNSGSGDQWLRFKDMWECGDPVKYSGSGDRNPNTFASFAVDAVYAFARAAHNMIERGDDLTIGADLLAELQDLVFDGVTGLVSFDSNGDRNAVYELLNLKGNLFESVASWDRVIGYSQYGNLTFANGTNVEVFGPGNPNLDPPGHVAQCAQFTFNDISITTTVSTIGIETTTRVETTTSTEFVVSTETHTSLETVTVTQAVTTTQTKTELGPEVTESANLYFPFAFFVLFIGVIITLRRVKIQT